MRRTLVWIILGGVALGGLLILALPGWMMLSGWDGGYGYVPVGVMQGFGHSPSQLGVWLGWATQFLWPDLLVIGLGGVALMKIKE